MELIFEKSPLIVIHLIFAVISGKFSTFKKLIFTIISLLKNVFAVVKFYKTHDSELHYEEGAEKTKRKYYFSTGRGYYVFRVARGGKKQISKEMEKETLNLTLISTWMVKNI